MIRIIVTFGSAYRPNFLSSLFNVSCIVVDVGYDPALDPVPARITSQTAMFSQLRIIMTEFYKEESDYENWNLLDSDDDFPFSGKER